MQLFLRQSLQVQNRDRGGREQRGDGGDCAQRERLHVQRKGFCIFRTLLDLLSEDMHSSEFCFPDILALSEF
jgi:hypothetical protein